MKTLALLYMTLPCILALRIKISIPKRKGSRGSTIARKKVHFSENQPCIHNRVNPIKKEDQKKHQGY